MVVVNSHDEELDIQDRRACHAGEGILHRAVSVFVFNSKAQLLVQQRHRGKALWGGSWSNTCCTHPVPGEEVAAAAGRRLQEEIGILAQLHFAFKFEYHARFDANWSERELCSVFVGHSDCEPSPDPLEVQGLQWMSASEVDEILVTGENCTPWFKMEWERLTSDHALLLKDAP